MSQVMRFLSWRVALLGYLVGVLLVARAGAAAADIQGPWASFGDTGEPTGYVRILKRGAEYYGLIEGGVSGNDAERRCDACSGAKHGRRMIGLEILWGIRRSDDGYTDGTILDPFVGKEYNVRLSLSSDGSKLDVFLAVPLLGRSQKWTRAAEPPNGALR